MLKFSPLSFPATLFCLFFAFFLLAPGPAQAQEAGTVWKMGTLVSTDLTWGKTIKGIISPAITRATEGNLRLKWYWGIVGGEEEGYVLKMRRGELDGAICSPRGLYFAAPEFSVLQLPFLFNDYEEVDHIKNALRPTFEKMAADRGFFLLSLNDLDFDQIYSLGRPMLGLSDFHQARFASWAGPVEQKMLEILGARTMDVKVIDSARTVRSKDVDAFIAPAVWVVWTQMHTVVRTVNPTRIRYSPGATLVNQKPWNQLPEVYRSRILAARDENEVKFDRQTREESKKALHAMVQYGIVPKASTPKELRPVKARCRLLWRELAGKEYPKETLDQILAELAKYRSGQKAEPADTAR